MQASIPCKTIAVALVKSRRVVAASAQDLETELRLNDLERTVKEQVEST